MTDFNVIPALATIIFHFFELKSGFMQRLLRLLTFLRVHLDGGRLVLVNALTKELLNKSDLLCGLLKFSSSHFFGEVT